MRMRKTVLWCLVLVLAVVLLAAGALYMAASWVPADYNPARLTRAEKKDTAHNEFWKRAQMCFNKAQEDRPFQWEESAERLNRYLAAMDEIAAEYPNRQAGDVQRAMESVGLSDPAVALGDGVVTIMFLAKEYNKVVSADIALEVTPERAIRVRLKEARVGHLPIPAGAVRGRLERLKKVLQDNRARNRDRQGATGPATGKSLLDDMQSLMPTVIAAIDEAPIPAEIPKWRVRIDEIRIADGRLTLGFSPLHGEGRKD